MIAPCVSCGRCPHCGTQLPSNYPIYPTYYPYTHTFPLTVGAIPTYTNAQTGIQNTQSIN